MSDRTKAKEDDVRAQNTYLSVSPMQWNPNERDYRYEFGFRLKKVMFAKRSADKARQLAIEVKFYKLAFSCRVHTEEAIEGSNFVKVSPVIIPHLRVGQRYIQEVIDYCRSNHIYGSFLATNHKPGGHSYKVDFIGLLHWFQLTASNLRQNIIFSGKITGVYPCYDYERTKYQTYLEFNHYTDISYYQSRFALKQIRPSCIIEKDVTNALKHIKRHCIELYTQSSQAGSIYNFTAIYVRKYTTLTVVSDNINIDKTFNRKGFDNKDLCHERILIQSGGVVGLEKYKLYYEFMNDEENKRYDSLEELLWSDRIEFRQQIKPVSGIKHPLIVLDWPKEEGLPVGKQAHFAGYVLRVLNTEPKDVREAILQFPTGARIESVFEFMPDLNENGKLQPSDGYLKLSEMWNSEPYKESTGPYSSVGNIDGETRSAFPNGGGVAIDVI